MKRWVQAGCIAAVLAISAPAGAGVILNDGTTGAHQIEFYQPIGQSFTAIDEHLISIAFRLYTINDNAENAPITLSLFNGEGFEGALLAQRTFSLPDSATTLPLMAAFFATDFGGVTLDVGSRYTAGLSTTSSRAGVIRGNNSYAGGRWFESDPTFDQPGCGAGGINCDLAFRIVGSMAAGVPEPSAWAFMILGFGAVGYALRRPVGRERRDLLNGRNASL